MRHCTCHDVLSFLSDDDFCIYYYVRLHLIITSFDLQFVAAPFHTAPTSKPSGHHTAPPQSQVAHPSSKAPPPATSVTTTNKTVKHAKVAPPGYAVKRGKLVDSAVNTSSNNNASGAHSITTSADVTNNDLGTHRTPTKNQANSAHSASDKRLPQAPNKNINFDRESAVEMAPRVEREKKMHVGEKMDADVVATADMHNVNDMSLAQTSTVRKENAVNGTPSHATTESNTALTSTAKKRMSKRLSKPTHQPQAPSTISYSARKQPTRKSTTKALDAPEGEVNFTSSASSANIFSPVKMNLDESDGASAAKSNGLKWTKKEVSVICRGRVLLRHYNARTRCSNNEL